MNAVLPYLFVGRDDELNEFRTILNNESREPRTIFIKGDGGIGKTALLREMLKIARQQAGVLTLDSPDSTGEDYSGAIIDFFDTDNRYEEGVQQTLIQLFGAENAESFAPFNQLNRRSPREFHRCLTQICQEQKLVLAFDTFELVKGEPVAEWLFSQTTDGLLVPGLICIIAGRETPDQDMPNTTLSLAGLNSDQAWEFYRRVPQVEVDVIGLEDAEFPSPAPESNPTPPDFIQALVQKTGGHPLLLGLAFTWLKQGMWSREAIEPLSVEEFEAKLMEQPREWGDQGLLQIEGRNYGQAVYQAIVCMGYLHRRFNQKIFERLIEWGFINFDDPNTVEELQHLRDSLMKFFFVKVRQGGEMQLHDELQRLVITHLWHFEDIEKKERLQRQTLELYDALIEEAADQ